jgi:hypothetical protein
MHQTHKKKNLQPFFTRSNLTVFAPRSNRLPNGGHVQLERLPKQPERQSRCLQKKTVGADGSKVSPRLECTIFSIETSLPSEPPFFLTRSQCSTFLLEVTLGQTHSSSTSMYISLPPQAEKVGEGPHPLRVKCFVVRVHIIKICITIWVCKSKWLEKHFYI